MKNKKYLTEANFMIKMNDLNAIRNFNIFIKTSVEKIGIIGYHASQKTIP